MPRKLAVLVGNGLSIAYNPELALPSITAEVVDRLAQSEGQAWVDAINAFADHALPSDASSSRDFEALVGAFGFESKSLGMLRDLAEETLATSELPSAIAMVAEYAEKIRDIGLSYVLEVIAERSKFSQNSPEPLDGFVRAIASTFHGITFGNLNYDTLLLAELLRAHKNDVADMGDGRDDIYFELGAGWVVAWPLRKSLDDLPVQKRIKLLQLHGSMAYWRQTPDSSVYGKLAREEVDSPELWKAIRAGSTTARPVVVLASGREKSSHVDEYPFAVCYQGFKNALSASAHWLIAGYSFRDEPVNSMLREEFLKRSPKPNVLVVTRGDDLDTEIIERSLGWGEEDMFSTGWLSILRKGIEQMPLSSEWAHFIK